MIDEGLFNEDMKTGTFDEQAKALLDGKAAMAIQVTSLLSNMAAQTDAATLNATIGFFPVSAKGALAFSVGSMQSLAIANPDLAKNLGDMIAGTKTAAQVGQETQTQFAQLAKAIGAKGF